MNDAGSENKGGSSFTSEFNENVIKCAKNTSALRNSKYKHNQDFSSKLRVKKKCANNLDRQSWSREQKKIVSDYFKEQINMKKPPKKCEVEEFLKLYPELFNNRKWTSVKAMVYNFYTGKLKVQ